MINKWEKRKQDRIKKRYTSLNHAIDVSGSPYQKTAFGLFSINRNLMNKFYKNFKKKFPRYLGRKSKASNLSENELKSIIKFFDSSGVHMRVAAVENKDWLIYKEGYSDRKKYFKERFYGIIYCIILKTCSYRNYPYPVTLCREKYLYNPEMALKICKEMSAFSDYNFSLSFGDRKVNDELKFADFIAGAGLKLNKKFLEGLENFYFIDIRIPPIYFLKVFNHYSK